MVGIVSSPYGHAIMSPLVGFVEFSPIALSSSGNSNRSCTLCMWIGFYFYRTYTLRTL